MAFEPVVTYEAWKLHDTMSGSTSTNIPTGAKELYIKISVIVNSQYETYDTVIVLDSLESGINAIRNGYGWNNTGNMWALRINTISNTIDSAVLFVNSTDMLSSSTTKVYYR